MAYRFIKNMPNPNLGSKPWLNLYVTLVRAEKATGGMRNMVKMSSIKRSLLYFSSLLVQMRQMKTPTDTMAKTKSTCVYH